MKQTNQAAQLKTQRAISLWEVDQKFTHSNAQLLSKTASIVAMELLTTCHSF